jgi:hypothetical protein
MDRQQRDEHKPREWLHVIDPPAVIANTSTGGTAQRYVLYVCCCGSLHKVTRATFLKRAAEIEGAA